MPILNHANDNNPPQALRFLSVCSGIEAASVAWNPLGWKAVAVAEIERFPSAVLAHHYPDVPNIGDFTKIDTTQLGAVDILCGGTPCQAFSVAGLRRGLEDARGNLTLKFVELAHELAAGNGLRNVVWENVPGVLSDKGNAFGCFLAGLVGADSTIEPPARGKWPRHGMVSGPKGRAAWAVKDAQFFGVAQRRRRVLVVADFGNGADPAAVLFEPEGVLRHPPARREAGQGVAGTIAGGARKSGGYSHDDVPLTAWCAEISPTICRESYSPMKCMEGDEASWSVVQNIQVSCITGDITHALTAEGHDASEDGSGRGTPVVSVLRGISDYGDGLPSLRAKGGDASGGSEALVCVHGTQDPCTRNDTAFALGRNSGQENVIAFSAKDYGADATLNLAPTLRAGGHTGSHANAGVMPAICFDTTQITSPANGSNPKPGDPCHPLSAQAHPPAIAGSAVRRLTPRECERLQGFQWLCAPDYPGAWQDEAGRWWSPDYTDIPWRGKPNSPDGPRYKALGNSWAVPKFRWLGERIQRFMPAVASNDNANDNTQCNAA